MKEWYELHGQTLSDGENRLNKLLNLATNLGDLKANALSKETFAEYRKQRLAGKFSKKPKTPTERSHGKP
ncbi:phage integrase [Avibacterium paragallinarum]